MDPTAYVIKGDNKKALDLQKKFAESMVNGIDSISVAGTYFEFLSIFCIRLSQVFYL